MFFMRWRIPGSASEVIDVPDPTDGQLDPVFNDFESEVGLPIGDGEVMRLGEFGATEGPVPEGGEVRSAGGNLRQMLQVFAENKLAVVSVGAIAIPSSNTAAAAPAPMPREGRSGAATMPSAPA